MSHRSLGEAAGIVAFLTIFVVCGMFLIPALFGLESWDIWCTVLSIFGIGGLITFIILMYKAFKGD